jgi:outer membrane protein OmpA-like peptidoglycan-associated protein
MRFFLSISYLAVVNLLYGQSSGLDSLSMRETISVFPLEIVNSPYRDVNLSITPNGKYLFFMSGRGETRWSLKKESTFKGKVEYDGDIWFSERINTIWQPPKYLPLPINSAKSEDEPNISPDGQTVYFQSWHNGWEIDGGPYYRAELYGNRWQNPTGLYGGIHQFFKDSMSYYRRYATDGMAISPNGKIFIVAAGVDYDGDLDLYISRKSDNNEWSYPKRLVISTKGEERSVFIAADGKTVYFGSSGHGGFGGLDIFKTTLYDNDSFGEIINIGAPFNTNQHDFGFIIGALGNEVFFVRNDDIYYAQLGEQFNEIKPSPTLVINGLVLDCQQKPVQATIELYDMTQNKLLATARSNSISGAYSIAIRRFEGKYRQRIRYANDTTLLRKDFDLTEDTPQLLELTIQPDCAPTVPVVIPPSRALPIPTFDTLIYFDFDKQALKSEEQVKLDSLVSLLQGVNGSMLQIHIVGHTDSWGSDAYNIKLSQRRATAVADYLRQHTEVALQVTYKGETIPLLENTTPQNRAKNRRVAVLLKEKDVANQ